MPLPPTIIRIPVPLSRGATVNAWLLTGRPLTLVDGGPRTTAALAALETGMARAGHRLEELETIVLTHHHLDHAGLTATIRRRSGAMVVAHAQLAAWEADHDDRLTRERAAVLAQLRENGMPPEALRSAHRFCDHSREQSEPFTVDRVVADGDAVEAGGRALRPTHRPGHSPTDTLWADGAKATFVGDHLLPGIAANTEMFPIVPGTDAARVAYLRGLRRTAAEGHGTVLPGHGAAVRDHRPLAIERVSQSQARSDLVASLLGEEASSVFDIAVALWGRKRVIEESVLTCWSVLGHLRLLTDAGRAEEHTDRDGIRRFTVTRRPGPPSVAGAGRDAFIRSVEN